MVHLIQMYTMDLTLIIKLINNTYHHYQQVQVLETMQCSHLKIWLVVMMRVKLELIHGRSEEHTSELTVTQ